MRKILAWFVGEGDCPGCEGALEEHEAGYHVCRSCSAVVDFDRGGWRYTGESDLRRLPGLSGLPWDRERRRRAA